jgi:hypothetical protein
MKTHLADLAPFRGPGVEKGVQAIVQRGLVHHPTVKGFPDAHEHAWGQVFTTDHGWRIDREIFRRLLVRRRNRTIPGGRGHMAKGCQVLAGEFLPEYQRGIGAHVVFRGGKGKESLAPVVGKVLLQGGQVLRVVVQGLPAQLAAGRKSKFMGHGRCWVSIGSQ